MYLIQVFLPLNDEQGTRFPREQYDHVERKLISHFSGFTAYPRMPASGLWKDSEAALQRDELVIYEVMSENLTAAWWSEFRASLEALFRQEKILIRSQVVELL
jgi:hypothetical protein